MQSLFTPIRFGNYDKVKAFEKWVFKSTMLEWVMLKISESIEQSKQF